MLPKTRRIKRVSFPKSKPIKSLRGSFVSGSLYKGVEAKTKFSFSISKKTAKTAVMRNKLRRIGYKAVQEAIDRIKNNYLVIFYIHSIPKNTEDLDADVKNVLHKLGAVN
jgi:ribonuclease P protein component